ncbi:unnamed protein product [Arabidopsis halleri]
MAISDPCCIRFLEMVKNDFAFAFFVEPNHDCLLECLPTCKSDSNLPKYPTIKCSTYLSQRYKKTHADLSFYEKKN